MEDVLNVVATNAGAGVATSRDDIEAQEQWRRDGTVPLRYVRAVSRGMITPVEGFTADAFVAAQRARVLLGNLRSFRSPHRVDEIEDQLFELGGAAAAVLEEAALNEREDVTVRASALRVLKSIEPARAYAPAIEAVRQSHDILREAAVEALGALLPNAHIEKLLRVIADRDPSEAIRRTADEMVAGC